VVRVVPDIVKQFVVGVFNELRSPMGVYTVQSSAHVKYVSKQVKRRFAYHIIAKAPNALYALVL